MELTEVQIELLERAHFGKLSEEDEQELKRLEADPEFKAEADTYRVIFQSINKEMDDALKSKMEIWEDESKRPATVHSLRKTMKYAAIMLGFMIAVVFFQRMLSHKTDTTEAFYKTYPNTITVRGTSENEAVVKAMSHYEKGEYSEAIELLESMPESISRDFYLGQSHFGKEDYEKARNYFMRISREKGVFKSTAEWYEQLCLLKMDGKGKKLAIKNLKRMVEEHHDFADDAQALLLTLENAK
jgi:TolA-binding protein